MSVTGSVKILELRSRGGSDEKSQRAHVFTRTDSNAGNLPFTVNADGDSPVHNPAFVVKNWGKRATALTRDGLEIPRGKDFRFGLQRRLDGTDLVVWVKVRGTQEIRIKLAAGE